MYADNDVSFASKLISDIEDLLDIHISVHDILGVFRFADGKPMFIRRYHMCGYCQAGRATVSGWEANCQRDCSVNSDSKAARLQKPFTKNCWKGVYDIVLPVVDGDSVVAVIYASGFRGEILEDIPSKYHKMHMKLRDIPQPPERERITRTLWQLGQALLNYSKEINAPQQESTGRRQIIANFIRTNAHKDLTLQDLCRELHLSASRTRHVVMEQFGRTFKHLVTAERMLRARNLLLGSDLSIEEICYRIGFSNVYYFNSAFKKKFGLPPGRYRRENS